MIINKAKPENGIIVGRFQPFHLEHLRFAVAAASRVNHLWVGITRPFGSYIQESGGARTTASANPLPYWLRFKCVETALLHDAGIPRDEFSILPAPLVPEILEQLVPKGSIFLTTIVNEWSVQKEELFLKAGFPAIRIDFEYRPISSTMIREKIRKGDESWKEFVPKSVSENYASLIDRYVRIYPIR